MTAVVDGGMTACSVPYADTEFTPKIARVDALVEQALAQLLELRAEKAELVAMLQRCSCPRPANSAPDDLSVEGCRQRGECGCDIGDLLAKVSA